MLLSVSQDVTFCCPSCRGRLVVSPGAYRCAACERSYPIVVGIPDFRLAPDPYISLAEEYEKARLLAEEANRRSFEDLVRFYWDITPDVPRELAERYISYAVEGERRGHAYRTEIDTRLKAHLGGEACLDVGCGTGGFLIAARSRFRRLIGIDIALRWLVIARKRLADAGENATLVCCSAEHLPFPAGTFDAAVCIDVLEHAQDPQAILMTTARALQPEGVFYIATPNRFSLGPEPCVRVWGVGFLSRSLASRYVHRVTGRPYRLIHLLSVFELRRMLARAGLREWSILPGVVPVHHGQSRFMSTILRVYNALRQRPIVARLLLIGGPYLEAVARR
ncbi:MAG: methyltransferase domain-containing protein [bacterium]